MIMKKKKTSELNVYKQQRGSCRSQNQENLNNNIRNNNKKSTKMFYSCNSILTTGLLVMFLYLVAPVSGISILHNRSVSSKLAPLTWSTSNTQFKPTSNRKYLQLTGQIGDNIDLICPKQDESSAEYLTIYKVATKEEFDNCYINPNNRQTVPILKCDKPQAAVKFTLFFIKFSPVPFALEFEEGKTYYFLTTSSGNAKGLDYMTGGLCNKFNMKFSIKIDSSNPEGPEITQFTTTEATTTTRKSGQVKSGETPLPSKMNLLSKSSNSHSFNIYFYILSSIAITIAKLL